MQVRSVRSPMLVADCSDLADLPPGDLWREIERRVKAQVAPPLRTPALVMHSDRMVRWRGCVARLTPLEARVLTALVIASPRHLSVRGLADATDLRWVRSHVFNLRRKLPGLIRSGPCAGYWIASADLAAGPGTTDIAVMGHCLTSRDQ